MSPTVVVIGGGYGGSAAAKALDGVADVVLVDPKDAFFHAVGALRAVVDPEFLPKVFFPYDKLLTNGRLVRDRAVRVEPGRVDDVTARRGGSVLGRGRRPNGHVAQEGLVALDERGIVRAQAGDHADDPGMHFACRSGESEGVSKLPHRARGCKWILFRSKR